MHIYISSTSSALKPLPITPSIGKQGSLLKLLYPSATPSASSSGSMAWRRLPTFFPNMQLRMLPLAEDQMQQLRETGWLREVAFRTQPSVNKVHVRLQ
jgi:hypothetical protein